MSSASDSEVSPPRTAQPERKRRRRPRATYHVRKDEIQTLQTRMHELELELKALKFQTFMSGSSDAASDTASSTASWSPAPSSTSSASSAASPEPSTTDTSASRFSPSASSRLPVTRSAHALASTSLPQPPQPSIAKGVATHRLLHDAVQTQQFALAGLQAMLSTYTSLQDTSPLTMQLRLPANAVERRALLVATRDRALAHAMRFLQIRSTSVDQLRAIAEQNRYETLRGTYCVSSFDVLPLPASASQAFSVQQAHATLCYLVRNVEITFTEWVGHLTVRENDDSSVCASADSPAAAAALATDDKLSSFAQQHKLVATCTTHGLIIETNVVTVADFNEATNVGVLIVDSVEDDALFPYQTATRIRRDTSGVFMFTCHNDTVVVTRWSHSIVHTSALLARQDDRTIQSVRASLSVWGDKLLTEVRAAAVRAATGAAATTAAGSSGSC